MSVDVKNTKLIHKSLLRTHESNSNKQSKHMFKELRKSIKENGFDETLIIVPSDIEAGAYKIISGNHRFLAGCAEGMEEFPCVIRDDWDPTQQQIELVRRNYVRGALDENSFTHAVDVLAQESTLALDSIREAMGFEDSDKFLEFYKVQMEKDQESEKKAVESHKVVNPQVRMVDNLGAVVSSILEQYGDTVPYSFIVFPISGKNHMLVATTPTLAKTMQQVAQHCISNHLDINVALGGLLVLGMNQANFGSKPPDDVVAAGNSVSAGEADLNLSSE